MKRKRSEEWTDREYRVGESVSYLFLVIHAAYSPGLCMSVTEAEEA